MSRRDTIFSSEYGSGYQILWDTKFSGIPNPGDAKFAMTSVVTRQNGRTLYSKTRWGSDCQTDAK